MVFRLVAVLLIATVCGAQTPMPANTPASSATGTITVPQGTAVPLVLITPIRSKSTKPGNSVQAQVAFPVTVGTQVAIPAGTYVQGIVNAVSARDAHTHMPSVKVHFTALLFPNGYSVPLDAMNSDAMLIEPAFDPGLDSRSELADARDGAPVLGEEFAAPEQNPPLPPLPPLPSNGPSPAVMTGVMVGVGVGTTALILVLAHHRAGSNDFLLFDNGWQLQMVLQQPLTLDAAKVTAAVSGTARAPAASH